MDDETKQGIDIEEARRWIIDHRTALNVGVREIARLTGIPNGTLSQFMSDKGYAGREENVAEKVNRYRQSLVAQASIEITPRDMPEWYDTESGGRLIELLRYGRMGEFVVAATGPGVGKTKAAKRFAWSNPNVFLVTMTPSTAGVNNMQIEVLEAMGERDAVGTPQKLSRRIRNRVEQLRNALIIFDEAQHLSEKAIEEIRSWNDATGVGIALFGNVGVIQRLEGGSRKEAFAQIYSRVSFRIVQPLAMQSDVAALAKAWGITAPDIVAYLRSIVMRPGALRGASKALRIAYMLADADQQPLNLGHLQDAWAQLSAQAIAA
ncbi:MAG: hypothetical protein COC10_05650 [Sphingobium sp.]|jgi:DNA transposition AAA+ family ATPase|nr:MAG: hypothetical protein COC10_05650 [Sphingobium sp.]